MTAITYRIWRRRYRAHQRTRRQYTCESGKFTRRTGEAGVKRSGVCATATYAHVPTAFYGDSSCFGHVPTMQDKHMTLRYLKAMDGSFSCEALRFEILDIHRNKTCLRANGLGYVPVS